MKIPVVVNHRFFILLVCIFAFCVGLNAHLATAQDRWMNQQFMPRANAEFKRGDRHIGPEKIPLPMTVTKVNGDWLWVHAAWVQKSKVVPLDQAINYYTDQIRRNPRNAWAYNMRGVSRKVDAGLFDDEASIKALADYNESIRYNPQNFAAWYNRAGMFFDWDGDMFWSENEDLENARDDYGEVIRLKPNWSSPYFRRGLILSWLGKTDAALRDLDKAVELGPEEDEVVELYFQRGQLLHAKKRHAQAIADYTEVIRRRPKGFRYYMSRGHAFHANGDYDKAIADFGKVIEIGFDEHWAHEYRGDAWRAKGDSVKAKAEYAAALRAKPDLAEQLCDWASDASKSGFFKSAIDYYDRATRIDEKHAQGFNGIAWVLATCQADSLRDGKKAVVMATRACELTEWKDHGYLDTLAASYAESGDFKEAVRWQLKAKDLAPADEKDDFQSRVSLYKSAKPYRTNVTPKG